jgi:CDP-diacylglycerol--glycerol-3-phosphate 3-phosphatidyltransferase
MLSAYAMALDRPLTSRKDDGTVADDSVTPRGDALNVPNVISLLRVAFVPAVIWLILADFANHERWAAAVYAVAAASDSLDGYLARRGGLVTVIGAFLDPLADKLLVSGALVALVQLGRLSTWVAMVIITREFAVMGVRLVAASDSNVISASWLGKLKTFSQNVSVVLLLLVHGHRGAVDAVVAIAIALTIWSFADYLYRARHHYAKMA